MPSPKLLAVITALMLVTGGHGAQAAYTSTQLAQIEQLIVDRNWAQLESYILANPELLDGEDLLATELWKFMKNMQAGIFTATFIPPSIPYANIVTSIRPTY
ncbi:MAG: hypothetical protein Q8O82_01980 [Pseudorhodobacter sp.]|nr:hypothetical protein [Pseudorhodobacter sp.]